MKILQILYRKDSDLFKATLNIALYCDPKHK